MDKLPDSEIVKALEKEIHLAEYVDSDYCSNTEVSLLKSALDLINRLQAENDRLKEEVANMDKAYFDVRTRLETAKAEAYKECIEKVEKELSLIRRECRNALDNDGVFAIDRARKKLDNLLKELVGDSDVYE